MKSLLHCLLLLAIFAGTTTAFQAAHGQNKKRGVRGTSLEMTVLTYNGKKMNFKPGSSLQSAAAALGVKPKYSCKK
jgi:hypothetical protein